MSKMISIYIYAALGLNGKVNSLINSILNKDIYLTSIESVYNRSLEGKSLEVLEEILEYLKNKYTSHKKMDTLVAYLSIGASDKFKDVLGEDYDIPNRLSDVRERTKSFNNSQRFPYAWSFWIEKYSSETELLSFLGKGLIYEKLKKNPGLITNFYSSFPKEANKREDLLSAFNKLKKQNTFNSIDQAVRIYSNQKFANYLKNNKSGFGKPLFFIEKKHYLDGLKRGNAPLYSIFNLLRLGIYQDDFLHVLNASGL